MSLKNEDYKEQLVEGILRGEREIFLRCRNDFYSDNFLQKTKCYSVFLWFRQQKSPV